MSLLASMVSGETDTADVIFFIAWIVAALGVIASLVKHPQAQKVSPALIGLGIVGIALGLWVL